MGKRASLIARGRGIALLRVIGLGVISRRYPLGLPLYDKSLGDALYAAAAYLALGLLRPQWPVTALEGAAFAFCLGIEAFQLTGSWGIDGTRVPEVHLVFALRPRQRAPPGSPQCRCTRARSSVALASFPVYH